MDNILGPAVVGSWGNVVVWIALFVTIAAVKISQHWAPKRPAAIQVYVGSADSARIHEIAKANGCTVEETVNDALRLYEWVTKETDKGARWAKIGPAGEAIPVDLFKVVA